MRLPTVGAGRQSTVKKVKRVIKHHHHEQESDRASTHAEADPLDAFNTGLRRSETPLSECDVMLSTDTISGGNITYESNLDRIRLVLQSQTHMDAVEQALDSLDDAVLSKKNKDMFMAMACKDFTGLPMIDALSGATPDDEPIYAEPMFTDVPAAARFSPGMQMHSRSQASTPGAAMCVDLPALFPGSTNSLHNSPIVVSSLAELQRTQTPTSFQHRTAFSKQRLDPVERPCLKSQVKDDKQFNREAILNMKLKSKREELAETMTLLEEQDLSASDKEFFLNEREWLYKRVIALECQLAPSSGKDERGRPKGEPQNKLTRYKQNSGHKRAVVACQTDSELLRGPLEAIANLEPRVSEASTAWIQEKHQAILCKLGATKVAAGRIVRTAMEAHEACIADYRTTAVDRAIDVFKQLLPRDVWEEAKMHVHRSVQMMIGEAHEVAIANVMEASSTAQSALMEALAASAPKSKSEKRPKDPPLGGSTPKAVQPEGSPAKQPAASLRPEPEPLAPPVVPKAVPKATVGIQTTEPWRCKEEVEKPPPQRPKMKQTGAQTDPYTDSLSRMKESTSVVSYKERSPKDLPPLDEPIMSEGEDEDEDEEEVEEDPSEVPTTHSSKLGESMGSGTLAKGLSNILPMGAKTQKGQVTPLLGDSCNRTPTDNSKTVNQLKFKMAEGLSFAAALQSLQIESSDDAIPPSLSTLRGAGPVPSGYGGWSGMSMNSSYRSQGQPGLVEAYRSRCLSANLMQKMVF